MCSSLYVCREIVDGRKLRFDVQKGCWDAGWESGSRAALAVLVVGRALSSRQSVYVSWTFWLAVRWWCISISSQDWEVGSRAVMSSMGG